MSQTPLTSVSIIPFIRANEVLFNASSLRPERVARFFFDETNVDGFVQKASVLKRSGATPLPVLTVNEGLYSADTRGFATVIGTTPINTVYVNDNYLMINVSPFSVGTLTDTTFTAGEVIFQSNNINNPQLSTFTGRVEYWNRVSGSDGVLAIKPISGTISAESTNRVIYKTGNNNSIANVSEVIVNQRFSVSSSVFSTTSPSKTFVIGDYTHNHGTITKLNSTTNQINLASNVTNSVVGQNITIITDTLSPQVRTIQSVAANSVLTLNAAVFGVTGNSKYSIGSSIVDIYGNISGIFNIPSNQQNKFKTGERLFTITDTGTVGDKDFTMKAAGVYSAVGLNTTRLIEPEIRTTPVPPPISAQPAIPRLSTFRVPRRGRDPIAQTFFAPNPDNDRIDYGTFVTSIELFFRQKPSPVTSYGVLEPELPVTVRIVETLNGYPTDKIIASSTVQCPDVRVTDGIQTFPSAANTATSTKFVFGDPVYLEPDTEYALVVFSESPSYEVWISELGQTIVGDSLGRRVSEQPYIGSFFRSQNASTWTPYQNQDLMFVINKAIFSSSPAVITFTPKQQFSNVGIDDIVVNSQDLNFPVTTLDYKLKTAFGATLAFDTSEIKVDANEPFNFGGEGNTSVKVTGKSRIILAGNANSFFMNVSMSTAENVVSPVINKEALSVIASKNLINNGELNPENFVVVFGGGSHVNAENIVITIGDSDLYPGERATANVLPSGLSGGNIVSINVINPGRGYVTSPTITVQDSDATSTPNASIVFAGEDQTSGGNCLTRFITRKVTLLDGFDSGDLRVVVRATRSQGTNIVAYYKVLSTADSEEFEDKKWKKMFLTNNVLSKDLYTPVDYIYRADPIRNKLSYTENDIEYPIGGKFKYFAVKIVMLSECSCISPTIENIKIIALPEG